jgi:hypothetical protein
MRYASITFEVVGLSYHVNQVDAMWKQPRSLASALFFLNRYFSLLEIFIVALISFNPAWTAKVSFRTMSLRGHTNRLTPRVSSQM